MSLSPNLNGNLLNNKNPLSTNTSLQENSETVNYSSNSNLSSDFSGDSKQNGSHCTLTSTRPLEKRKATASPTFQCRSSKSSKLSNSCSLDSSTPVQSQSQPAQKSGKGSTSSSGSNCSLEAFGFKRVEKKNSPNHTEHSVTSPAPFSSLIAAGAYGMSGSSAAPNGFRNTHPNHATPPNVTSHSSGTKKLAIKNFKERETNLEAYGEMEWKKLESAVRAIEESRPYNSPAPLSSLNHTVQKDGSLPVTEFYSLEELYKAVENMCTHHLPQLLYQRLRVLLESYTRAALIPFRRENLDVDSHLGIMNKCWQSHCEKMLMIRSIFLYLDRTYVLQNTREGIESVWDMGLGLFREHILTEAEVRERTISGLLQLVGRERRGELDPQTGGTGRRALLSNLVRMLLDLRLYSSLFEPRLLAEGTVFYREEGSSLVERIERADDSALATYLAHASARLDEEHARLHSYLDQQTLKPLIRTVEQQLIEVHVKTLLEKGFDQLVQHNRLPELSRMFSLFNRVSDGIPQLCIHFANYIKRVGRTIVLNPSNDAAHDAELVSQLLDLKEKVDHIAFECFNRHERFIQAVKDAFEAFINERANKPAEMLAKFVDAKLRAGNKEVSEEELDRLLDRILILFRFLNGKDMFEAFYKKDLAKRLLLGKSASVDAEKLMLSKLKHECGAQFTMKLEGMFKDIEISKDISIAFKQFLAGVKSDTPHLPDAAMSADGPGMAQEQLDMSVNVLTQGYWPSYPIVVLRLPEQLQRQQELFTRFYLSKHNGRKLLFQPTLGHAVVRAQFLPELSETRKELQVSLLQCLVLLLFNEPHPVGESLGYSEIKTALGMSLTPTAESGQTQPSSSPAECQRLADDELKRTLQSLACGKTRVLNKEPKGKDINTEDRFFFNSGFRNKHYRIKINQVQMKETQEEQSSTEERVFADRQYQVDAAIVRIMKMRKTLTHAALVSELYQLLKFPLKSADIKKRIESLIERDYMQRSKDNANEYNYVA